MATKDLRSISIESQNHRNDCPSRTFLGYWRGDPRINQFRDLIRKKIKEDITLNGQNNNVLYAVEQVERELFLRATSLEKYINLSTLKDRAAKAIKDLYPAQDVSLHVAINITCPNPTQNTFNLAQHSGPRETGHLKRVTHLMPIKKRPYESQLVKPSKSQKIEHGQGHSRRQDLHSSINPNGNIVKTTTTSQENSKPRSDDKDATNSDMINVTGVSLLDFFSLQDIKRHLSNLRNQTLQATGEKNENKCRLCGKGNLQLHPDPKYCYLCGNKIKNGGVYYTTSTNNDSGNGGNNDVGGGINNDDQWCFCGPCRTRLSKKIQLAEGITIFKTRLQKRNHNKGAKEEWVKCDVCKTWYHQICALYNAQRADGEKYKCPYCCLDELKAGKRIPVNSIPAAFTAQGLRQTSLSKHLEKRLSRSLKQERKQRAKMLGREFEKIPTAENLFIREVSSVKRILKVDSDLLDIITDANYPSEFPYKSKMIILFQRIDGVDVAIFGMHVQEYGSECAPPNRHTSYISYLDSIKYFTPTLETANGESLRSFVYHEILIGYLEYLKQREFSRCYIWACPPKKGDDYLFYCHPETQRIPKPQQLRKWYLSMINKAKDEKIVVSSTNLYERHFHPTKGVPSKITAASLPYYEGDSWLSIGKDLIRSIKQKDEDSQKARKNHFSKRSMMTIQPSKDIKGAEFMDKLGKLISPHKEDFIVIQLQFECSRCREVILSGKRWYCTRCKNFQLCKRCHEIESLFEDPDVHIVDNYEKHPILQDEVRNMPLNVEDAIITIENHPSFENRSSLLDFCQENGFQFDTLRRAKHSSMMILHYLNNRNDVHA